MQSLRQPPLAGKTRRGFTVPVVALALIIGGAVGNVVIRYNTFYDNRGPSNVQLSYGASRVRIYRNIFVRSGYGKPNVTTYRLSGYGNVVADNVGASLKFASVEVDRAPKAERPAADATGPTAVPASYAGTGVVR